MQQRRRGDAPWSTCLLHQLHPEDQEHQQVISYGIICCFAGAAPDWTMLREHKSPRPHHSLYRIHTMIKTILLVTKCIVIIKPEVNYIIYEVEMSCEFKSE